VVLGIVPAECRDVPDVESRTAGDYATANGAH